VASFANKVDFGAMASKVGNGEEVGAEVRDVKDVLQDTHDPFASSMHVDVHIAYAGGRDAAVIAKHDFAVVGEGTEGCEPGVV
jgi:hypothetical protein